MVTVEIGGQNPSVAVIVPSELEIEAMLAAKDMGIDFGAGDENSTQWGWRCQKG